MNLVFGISLGSWLLLTAAGAWLGRWLAPKDLRGEADSNTKAAAGCAPLSRDGDGNVAGPVNLLVVGPDLPAVLPLMQVVAIRVLRRCRALSRRERRAVTGTCWQPGALLPFCLVAELP